MNDDMLIFPKNKGHEIFFAIILIVSFFVLDFLNFKTMNVSYSHSELVLFGLLHLLSSNLLSYMYNLSYRATLIPWKVKPWFTKFLGFLILLNSLRIILLSS